VQLSFWLSSKVLMTSVQHLMCTSVLAKASILAFGHCYIIMVAFLLSSLCSFIDLLLAEIFLFHPTWSRILRLQFVLSFHELHLFSGVCSDASALHCKLYKYRALLMGALRTMVKEAFIASTL
jgi:hypothetical protein